MYGHSNGITNSPSQSQIRPLAGADIERIASVMIGSVITLRALRRAPFGLLLALLGATLLYRGLVGQTGMPQSLKSLAGNAQHYLNEARAKHQAAESTTTPSAVEWAYSKPSSDSVTEASKGSFPASDPPGSHSVASA